MSQIMYWIDDSIGDMIPVVEGLFPLLWKVGEEEGTKTKIIIWGDAYQEVPGKKGWTQKDETDLYQRIKYFFLELCQDNDGASWKNETYNRKKHLIEDGVLILSKEDVKSDTDELMNELKQFWNSEEKMQSWIGEKDQNNDSEGNSKNDIPRAGTIGEQAFQLTEKLVQQMQMEERAKVAIDVRLLLQDYERVNKGFPVISMELFHQLHRKKHICCMYSTYGFEASYNQKWKDIYKKIYKEDAPKIFSRANLSAETLDPEISRIFINEGEEGDVSG